MELNRDLYDFADKYRQEMLARETEHAEELARMCLLIKASAAPYNELWKRMNPSERRSVPLGDGKFIVAQKSARSIRMVLTTKADERIGGPLPRPENVIGYQEVVYEAYGRSDGELEVAHIYYLPEEDVSKLGDGSGVRQLFREIEIRNIDQAGPDGVVESYQTLGKIMPVPQALLNK